MSAILAIMRRELRAYVVSPPTYVFIVVFLLLANALTFYVDDFYKRGLADLQPFFAFHPWLYLFLVPALCTRLWVEERKSGTLELLLTLPLSLGQAMLGKFLAGWVLVALSLALTLPLWLSVNYLGQPDNGVILAGYLGSLLMAGAFVAVACCLSTLARSQVMSFILTVAVCLLLLLAGHHRVLDLAAGWLPPIGLRGLADLSFLHHFEAIAHGVLDMRDVCYFVLTIVTWLLAGVLLLDIRRAS